MPVSGRQAVRPYSWYAGPHGACSKCLGTDSSMYREGSHITTRVSSGWMSSPNAVVVWESVALCSMSVDSRVLFDYFIFLRSNVVRYSENGFWTQIDGTGYHVGGLGFASFHPRSTNTTQYVALMARRQLTWDSKNPNPCNWNPIAVNLVWGLGYWVMLTVEFSSHKVHF